MTDSLLHAYLPLFFWSGIGVFLLRFLPESFPRLLGRSLYWVGIPLEIFALARQTRWSTEIGLAPLVTVSAVSMGMILAWLALQIVLQITDRHQSKDSHPSDCHLEPGLEISLPGLETEPYWQRSRQGSFILASMLGNTGFVGLAVVPTFVSEPSLSWLILYSITQNVLGTYGMGVLLASYFGHTAETNRWWMQLRDVLSVPSLWAFVLGSLSQSIAFPDVVESSLKGSIWVIIPAALLLMGMRLSQLRGWQSLRVGIVPSLLKSLAVPGLVGLLVTTLHLTGDARLSLVLMAGMPTAFAGLILAEEYELDRELIASSIVLTTGLLIVTIPLWLLIFGQS